MLTNSQIIEIIKKDVAPALGCTEPIAVALAVCRAREILGAIPQRIELQISGNMFKNARDVGIPGCKKSGIQLAAAIGALTGYSKDKLELLKDINDEVIEKARKMVDSELISLSIKYDVDPLFIEAKCYFEDHNTTVVIEKRHTNIVYVMSDGDTIFIAKDEKKSYAENESGRIEGLNVKRVLEFAENASFEEIKFILDGVNPNIAISEEGVKNDYGLKIGKTLINDPNFSSSELIKNVCYVSGAIDARMSGSIMPVMTNSGSGNQGLTIYIPIVRTARLLGVDDERLARALIVGNTIPIHIKKQIGPLSALCGLIPASIGAGCGILYLYGADYEKICSHIKYMIANVAGVFCDGAKASCAVKVATCLGASIQAVIFAQHGVNPPFNHGIVEEDVEKTIDNLALIASKGMIKTDEEILKIMAHGCL